MHKRFVAIWFPQLIIDWLLIRKPALHNRAFVFVAPVHGRMRITAVSTTARAQGINPGMMLADARTIIASLSVFNDKPERQSNLLKGIAEFCIRFTPVTAIDLPEGIILDISGCAHLFGGERSYLSEIINRLKKTGYHIRAAIADSIGCAWAIARFGKITAIIKSGEEADALHSLPVQALRLPFDIIVRLQKLGLYNIGSIINMPRSAVRRRFGEVLLLRMDQALGKTKELVWPLQTILPYQERLSCLEPLAGAGGIEIALRRLLDTLCTRLQQEGNGLRTAAFAGYRLDGGITKITIGTNRPTYNTRHLLKLFQTKLETFEPGEGIELFVLEALNIEPVPVQQQKLWAGRCGLSDAGLAELLDRIANRTGVDNIYRYLPDEHYWPERSIRISTALTEQKTTPWQTNRPRPTQLLKAPEPIEVTAPLPDYPPMLFRYKNKLHKIRKADGPERIEREWWLEQGLHRDYYYVEDEEGRRYWLFRSGQNTGDKTKQWFIHGFYA